MAAGYQYSRIRRTPAFRHVKEPRNINAWQTLEDHFLDSINIAFDHARDARVERGFLRELAETLLNFLPYFMQVSFCLGATAAQALLGRDFRVSRQRGELVESDLAENVIATVHPSSILRADDETREQEYRELVGDLKTVARLI